MQTALYGKIKEKRSEWLIRADTQNKPYISIVTTQDKTKARETLMKLIQSYLCNRFQRTSKCIVTGKKSKQDFLKGQY